MSTETTQNLSKSIKSTPKTIKIKKKSHILHDLPINKEINIKNKGTGAGGSNTNKNGLPYFWGSSETYKNDIINFIINYK